MGTTHDPVLPADALARAKAGELLGRQDLMAIFRIGGSQFDRLNKAGAFDQFKVRPAIGPKSCFSGILVARYVNGDAVYEPTFGRRRRRA